MIVTKKEVKSIVLDPNLETADADLNNNYFPRQSVPTRFQVFKTQQGMRRGRGQTAPNSTTVQPTATTSTNLTGKWAIAVDAGGQTITMTLNLTQTGTEITGTLESAQGSLPISSGTFSNGELLIKTTAPVALTINAQVNGNAMSGNFTAPQGTTTFSGAKTP